MMAAAVGVLSTLPAEFSSGPTCSSLRPATAPAAAMLGLDSCSMPAALLAMLPKQAAMEVQDSALWMTVPASSSGV